MPMTSFSLPTNLTSADWAAWAQAVGTIFAVLAAAGIAVWQSRRQHRSAMLLHSEEQRHARVSLARSLLVIAHNCRRATTYLAEQMGNREAIHNIASGEKHFDYGELRHLENATSGIPLYSLPDVLVSHAMTLAATIRQFRETVEIAIRQHRNMDGAAFSDVFRTFAEMNESLRLTCDDIGKAVEQIESDV